MSIYSQITANKVKTWLIITLFIAFISTIAFVFGKASGYGLSYVGIAFLFSGIISFFSYYYSDQFILAVSGAKPIEKKDNPQLYNTVENLCIGDGVPLPKIYIMNEQAPNAFATGRNPSHAVVCVTQGLLNRLDHAELEGVIAHELSHVKNYDTRLMSIVVILVGVVALLADMFLRSMWFSGGRRSSRDEGNGQSIFLLIGIVLAILSPIIATLIQLAVSRKRELLADASGALLTRYPEGLASALEKIARDPTPLYAANNATAHLYIMNPFKGKDQKNWFTRLFDTHPPISERLKILRSM